MLVILPAVRETGNTTMEDALLPRIVVPICVSMLASCAGTIDPLGPPSAMEPGIVATPPGAGSAEDGAGPMPLRRLTRREYQNSLRDLGLVDDAAAVAKDIPADGTDGTAFEVATPVTEIEIERFLAASEQIGRTAAARLGKVLPCDPVTTGEEACARQFVVSFGRRAYRRPLATDETDALMAFFRRVRTDLKYDFADGVRMLVEAMLQSPNFLYHKERGPASPIREGALVRLDAHEVASRLSYYLWSSMPDAELFEVADAGKLDAAADIAAQARRMVADPKTRDTIQTFYGSLLSVNRIPALQKDTGQFAAFTPDLSAAMAAETRMFVADVFEQADGRFETLLAAPYTFVNETLAKLYGLAGITGSQMRKVSLPGEQRRGVLTQAGLLAVHSLSYATSPVKRGKFILDDVLCMPPPPPPPNVMTTPPARDRTLPRREQYEQHATVEPCRSCHLSMDNIGFLFEAYDAIGRFRTTENGKPLDSAATIPALDGADRFMSGAPDLATWLSESPQARGCAVRQWLRFALRRAETPQEEGSVMQALREFGASGWNLRALIAAVPETRSFRYRVEATP